MLTHKDLINCATMLSQEDFKQYVSEKSDFSGFWAVREVGTGHIIKLCWTESEAVAKTALYKCYVEHFSTSFSWVFMRNQVEGWIEMTTTETESIKNERRKSYVY